MHKYWTVMDDLVTKAIATLKEQTDLAINATRVPAPDGDAQLTVKVDNKSLDFVVEEKRHLANTTARQLAAKWESPARNVPTILVSEYINPSVGKLLRDHEINYLDTAGNCYLRKGNLYVLITGLKPETTKKSKPSRAFREAGLKLIFVLLSRSDYASKTYRELSELADISRGAVGYVMSDLEEMGYILEIQRGQRKLRNKGELIEKWTTNYGETLRPKLVRGRYRLIEDNWTADWKNLDWNAALTRWGGEPAGDILTRYLKPEIFTLYTREDTTDILKKIGAVPNAEGNLEIVEMFWDPEKINDDMLDNEAVVPPLLIYADLIASGDERNVETARRLYEEHVADTE